MNTPQRLNRTSIRVSGADAVSFLNNLLTADVAPGGVRYAALLSPQGKVNADMLVWDVGDGAVIECDPSRGADLQRRLSMYKLRAQVTIEDVSADLAIAVSDAAFDGAKPDPRNAALGWRSLVRSNEAAFFHEASGYEAKRIALGVPDLAHDAAPDDVFALEALLEELNGVSFQKGCFVGQENVSRMKRRATTRKKFCPIVFDGEAPALGTPVIAGAAELGSVRTGINGRAIALLRLDRALEAIAVGQTLTADGRAVRLDPPDWLILPQRDEA